MSVFERAEFEARLARAQQLLQQHEIDLLLLTTHPNLFWFTGFLTRFWESPTRPWFLLVPAQGPLLAVIPSIGEALMRRTWVSDIRCWPSPRPDDEGISLLAEAIAELAPSPGARLAIADGPESVLRMPQSDFRALGNALAPRRFESDQGIMRRLRLIKSSAEIARIEHSCAIATRAFDRLHEIAWPGRTHAEVFRAFQCLCLEEGADTVSYLAGGAGPDGYEDVISPAAEVPLQAGDVLMLDTGVIASGYHCDFNRNFALLRSSPLQRTTHARLIEATAETFAACRAGMSAADLHAILHAALARGPGAPDYRQGGRLGHGLGIQLTEWPSLTADDHTPLEVGMVLTLEPWLHTRSGCLMVHEENIVIEADGVRWLSRPESPELTVIATA